MFTRIRNFFRQTITPSTLKGIAQRAGAWVDENYRCVETSRYTHATRGGHRIWFSKPAAGRISGGAVVEEEGGRIVLTVTNLRGQPVGQSVAIDPEVAQGIGAMLRSAAVRAKPSTGRKMEPCLWTPADEQAKRVGDSARWEASLFDGI